MPTLKQTVGSGNYSGTYAAADFGDDFHLKPAFNTYHSDTSSGTFNTYSLDASYEWDEVGLTVTGGFTPTVSNYNNHYLGGRVSRFFDFGSSTGTQPFIRGAVLNAGLTQTIHGEIVTTPAVISGTSKIPAATITRRIQETDVEGSAAVTTFDLRTTFDLTKSVYDQDLAALSARAAAVVRLAGLNQTIQGFPDFNGLLKIELKNWESVTPYVSYDYTSFKAGQPTAATYGIGVTTWGPSDLKLDAGYQRYAQRHNADINYYSLSASWRFE